MYSSSDLYEDDSCFIKNYAAGSLILNSCASSLIDEDDYSKALGIVSRLMGLDSFPTSNVPDIKSKSARFIDTQSMHNSSPPSVDVYKRITPPDAPRYQKVLEDKSLDRLGDVDNPEFNELLKIAVRCLKERPVMFKYCAEESPRRLVKSKVSPPRVVESNAARSLKGQSMNKNWDDSDVRSRRRIKRDTVERGRNIQYVLDQYDKHVKPSFEEFILPSKKHADIIIPRGADNYVAIDLIIRGMHTLIRDVKTRKHDFVCYDGRLIRLNPSTQEWYSAKGCVV
ncbi:uridine kinase-like protein 5 [Tanacetum coccineum]